MKQNFRLVSSALLLLFFAATAPLHAQWVSENSTLEALTGNAAYLVSVSTNALAFPLQLLGKPLAPNYSFSSSGLNFLGFPSTATPTTSSGANLGGPFLDTYFSFSEVLGNQPEVYEFAGGPISESSPKNPQLIGTPRIATVARGRASWMRPDHPLSPPLRPIQRRPQAPHAKSKLRATQTSRREENATQVVSHA